MVSAVAWPLLLIGAGVVAAVAARQERRWWLLRILGLAQLAVGPRVAASLNMSIAALRRWVPAERWPTGSGQIASTMLVCGVGSRAAVAVERNDVIHIPLDPKGQPT